MHFIPTRIYGVLDHLVGALLIASPWLFGFSGAVHVLHLVLRLLEIVAALMTGRVPGPAIRQGA